MTYQADVITVMIASPGDVATERRRAVSIVHDWNGLHSRDRSQVLLPVAWENNAFPAMGNRAQAIINEQLLAQADVLVAIFWTRIGTATGQAAGGTVEEVERHIAAGRPAMLYFSSAPVAPQSLDPEQYQSLKSFRAKCEANGLVETYDSLEEFENKLRRQLTKTIMDRFPRASAEQSEVGSSEARLSIDERDAISTLSPESRELLQKVATSQDGIIMVLRTLGGTAIQVGGDNIVKNRTPREEARWLGAIKALSENNLIEQRDWKGEVFAISDLGYRIADLLGL